jgi:DHA3 family multidrug efflux protein-like MFS transporter
MRTFYQVLINNLIAGVTNNYVWFALVFWLYLETRSVFATSIVSGFYILLTAIGGFWFGSIVDHHKKKTAMLISSIVTLIFFSLSLFFFLITPSSNFQSLVHPELWILIILILLGAIAGNIRNIALPTTVTLLVEEKNRDKANGLSGSMMGVSFTITSVASGLVLAYGGMFSVLLGAVILTLLALAHLYFVPMIENKIVHLQEDGTKMGKGIDIKGTIAIISSVPGLFALIFFNMFNNFLGGVFMSLMDAYGLNLVSVQWWGTIFGLLSFCMIIAGLVISKTGLGKNPLRTMMLCNIAMWISAALFTVQPWLWLLILGMAVWMSLMPFIEASEQTVLQKVVPPERQGRVFGLAQSMEQAATPITAFLIGPITQFVFIPFMTTGKGVELIGNWYGVGDARGIALVFTVASLIGLIVTIIAMNSKYYHQLSRSYLKK